MLVAFTAAFGLLTSLGLALRAQNKRAADRSVDAPRRAEAKTSFDSICASCHGLDGRGGERGPDIVTRPDTVNKSDMDLFRVLEEGRTAAGMPSFASYGRDRLLALVDYLRTLEGRSNETPLPGDPARGKTLFFGKAKCSDCHMVGGRGGFFGQDLTAYAARLGADEVRAAIVNPNKDLDPRRGLVTVTLGDATALTGVARNEDNFSLQLQTPDGAFHFLDKSDIRSLSYVGTSLMPADYGTTLSPAELNDLVSYLLFTAKSGEAEKAKRAYDDDDED
jgi:putative heme-binding domain-containing protein